MLILLGLVVFILVGVLYFVGTAYAHAKLDIKAQPREEMWWCPWHGQFRKSHCLWLDGRMQPLRPEEVTPDAVACCPVCWYTKYKAAEKETYSA